MKIFNGKFEHLSAYTNVFSFVDDDDNDNNEKDN